MRSETESRKQGKAAAGEAAPRLECVSAVALATHDMAASVRFYRALGFVLTYGGEGESFSTLRAGVSHLNLVAKPRDARWNWWGRIIFHVSDVDAMFARAVSHGFAVEAEPRTADWGERYFHMTDPDGHELSFATPID